MSIKSAISEREKGATPMSIGTSLAVESLCGFGEFPNDKPHINNINELWVNLRTVFRNFYTAINKYERESAVPEDFIDFFVEDLNVLKSTIEAKSNGYARVVFYFCEYKGLKREFPHAKLKVLTTDKQILDQKLEDALLRYFVKNEELCGEFDIRIYDTVFKDKGGVACILTHHATDLLNRKRFTKLWLLESHTGAIKGPEKWYTKLTGGSKLTRIPFNRLTVQVIGDNNIAFSAMGRNVKAALLEMAESNRWNTVTTLDKVRYSISKLKDEELKKLFLSLL